MIDFEAYKKNVLLIYQIRTSSYVSFLFSRWANTMNCPRRCNVIFGDSFYIIFSFHKTYCEKNVKWNFRQKMQIFEIHGYQL